MKNIPAVILILLLLILTGCNYPTSLPISEKQKGADDFARHFIANVLNSQIDSCYADLSPEKQNIHMRYFLTNANKNIAMAGHKVTGYKVVEAKSTYGLSGKAKDKAIHNLWYEIEFDKANVLFMIIIYESDGQFKITSIDGQVLKAPLAELTKFTLTGKTFIHYLFLVFIILIPLFIIVSWIFLLFSKLTIKGKIIWSLIILFVNLPQLNIIWNTGNTSFQLITLSLLGSGFVKTSLYAGWILHFSIPLGAIVFWIKRKSLIIQSSNNTEQETATILRREEDINHTAFMPKLENNSDQIDRTL